LKKVLILGGSGMLGHTLFRHLALQPNLEVYATVRSPKGLLLWFSQELLKKICADVDANNFDSVTNIISSIQPDIVINCIGMVSKFRIANDLLSLINVNARFPHRVAFLCQTVGAKLIHISTDGVFDGKKGMDTESDEVNISDIYGMSKFLGEVRYPHCLTLRTSIIGHELEGKKGLVEWFLSQKRDVRGYTKAIYSGLPTIELSEIIKDYILPNDHLAGIFKVLFAVPYSRQLWKEN
jgi:dTDP-4-dehydrorhamnose reductase